MTRYWLIKSEPDVFSIEDLKRDGVSPWDGVRNYQARNFMRDMMRPGDLALFYHSNAKPPGVVGIAKVCSAPYADPSAFDKRSKYFDPKSDPANPRWILVDFEYVTTFPEIVALSDLKDDPKLEGMLVSQKGQRLSVQPVEDHHFKHICSLANCQI